MRLDDLEGPTCPTCGREPQRNANAIYCSRACKRKAENARRYAEAAALRAGLTCPLCGATFDASTLKQIYCSPRCQSRSADRRRSPRRRSRRPRLEDDVET